MIIIWISLQIYSSTDNQSHANIQRKYWRTYKYEVLYNIIHTYPYFICQTVGIIINDHERGVYTITMVNFLRMMKICFMQFQ